MPRRDRILIVDDDADTRTLLEGVLQQAGFETASAEEGRRALELMDQAGFDLILTDKNMAGMNGPALLAEVWKRFPNVGGAMITGYRSDDLEGTPWDGRVLAYFEKPIYDLREVANTLRVVLEQHRKRLGLSS